jgi:hypothetical protein
MRRVCQIVVFAALFQGLLVSPTYAWWDDVEHMSGPGRFFGWDLQARLFCAVDVIPVTSAEGKRDKEKDPREVETKTFIPTTIGIITSTCRPEEIKKDKDGQWIKQKNRLAIDVMTRFVKADDNPNFANGRRISLTTLQPQMSIALLNKFDNWDILDYGFGAGVYWFSSTEFPSFHGAFLEPIRFEVHAPFNWRRNAWSAAVPRGRVGYLVFPAGFETASWAAAPGIPPRISRDWVLNFGIDFDVSPLLAKLAP